MCEAVLTRTISVSSCRIFVSFSFRINFRAVTFFASSLGVLVPDLAPCHGDEKEVNGARHKKIKFRVNTSKTHKRLKECFLIGRNWTKRASIRGSPLFQAMYNIKTEKRAITSIN